MSSLQDPDTQPIAKVGERGRAAIYLGVLVVVAIVVVAVMLYALRNNSTGTGASSGGPQSGPAVVATGDAKPSASSPATSPPRPKPTKRSTHPTQHGPVSCPTSAPCSLSTDVGNALGALNDYRTAHGQKPVDGTVTQAARDCALSNGSTSACPSGYFWEPVGRSGTEVIQKIAAASQGTSWLLDKTMTSIQIGWVYIPTSKSFECVLVSVH